MERFYRNTHTWSGESLPVANADRQCVATQTAGANHPFLINTGYAEAAMLIPWLGNQTLWFDFG